MELNSFCKAVKEASGKKIAYKALKAFHFQNFLICSCSRLFVRKIDQLCKFAIAPD